MEFSNIQLIIKQGFFIYGISVSTLFLFFGLVLNCLLIIGYCYKTEGCGIEMTFVRRNFGITILVGNISVVGGIIGIILTIVLTP